MIDLWCPETDLNRRHADFQSVATPAITAACTPAERQTAPGGSSTWTEVVKPQEGF